MNSYPTNWREDVKLSRDIADREKAGFELLLSWFERWRISRDLKPDRQSAKRFWREEISAKKRHGWQLQQWAAAIAWYLNWMEICRHHGHIPISLAERMRSAVIANAARRGLAPETRKSYGSYVARYGAWVGDARAALSPEAGTAWLQDYGNKAGVARPTLKAALNALVFFYREVCKLPPEDVVLDVRFKESKPRIPVVMSGEEVSRVLAEMSGVFQVYARLQYGTGMRISELMSLRVKDVDWSRNQVVIRAGKGDKDRVTMLPACVKSELLDIRDTARPVYDIDRAAKLAGVKLPNALAQKLPSAPESWEWFWMLPSKKLSHDPDCGTRRRHHVHAETYRRAVKKAVQKAKIDKRVTPHVFRHCFATHLLESGTDIRSLQDLLGHDDVRVTMRYTHVAQNIGATGVKSPLDLLDEAAAANSQSVPTSTAGQLSGSI